jgi:hypothetical protein
MSRKSSLQCSSRWSGRAEQPATQLLAVSARGGGAVKPAEEGSDEQAGEQWGL